LKIVRVENASLAELSGIFIEIMENKALKPGSCVLISSLSFLSKVGVSAYAAEWRICTNMLSSKWPGILVCPVFPIHFSVIPGSLYGDLLVLHSWFKRMYSGTNQGLTPAWDRYVEHLRNFSEGAETLDSPEISSPLLPSTLDPQSGFVTQKFASSTTSPSVIFSFDRHTVYELLLSLAVSLRRGFSISAHPEVILARELAAASESAKETGKVKTIILAGASNLGSLKPIFQAHGANVIDLTKPGWMITEKNLELLSQELSALSNMEDTAVIFDIFGNSAFKFQHVDGTLVLPFRVGGGYHFLGDISMDSDSKIGELISQAKPVFCSVKNLLCIIMPPNPRYVYSGCCNDRSHSTNLGADNYPAQILEAALHFRKILKTSLVGSEELGRFWVMDTLSCLGSIPPTMPEKLEAVRLAIGPDGVHFTESGRHHLFANLAKTIIGLQDGTVGKPPKTAEAAASVSVPGRRFYWRGFNSDRGSTSRPIRGGPAGSRGRGDGRARGGGAARGGAGRGGQYRHDPYNMVRGRGTSGRGRGRD
jgi:hypothetical protein